MTFKYKCIDKKCISGEEIIKIKKCPCKAFSKEYCESCGKVMKKI